MTSPNLDFEVIIKIDFKLKTSPYTVNSRYIGINSYEPGELFASQTYNIYGGLIQVDSLGVEMSGPIPSNKRGAVIIKNGLGGVSYRNRFSDWLDKETIIAQPFTLYYFKGAPRGGNPDTSLTQEVKGRITEVSFNGSQIYIAGINEAIPLGYPQLQIDSTHFPSAPDGALGQYLPIWYGNPEMPSVCCTTGNNNIFYAYGTGHFDDTSTTLPTIYVADVDGDYAPYVYGSTITAAIDYDISGDESGAPTSSNIHFFSSSTGLKTFGFRLPFDSSTPNIIANGWMYFYDGTAGTQNGYFNFFIYDSDDTGYPRNVIASARRAKTDYTWSGGNAQQKITFTFDKVAVLNPNKDYFFVFSQSNNDIHLPVQDSGSTLEFWGLEENTWRRVETSIEGSPKDINFVLQPVAIETDRDGPSDEIYGVKLTQVDFSGGGLSSPPLDNLSLVVTGRMPIDDASGTVTGSAYGELDNAAYAIKHLLSDDTINISTFNAVTVLDTYYPRGLDGASGGREDYRSIIGNICKDTSCLLVPRRNGSLAVWPYGYETSSTIIISEADCNLQEVKLLGTESIVNEVDLSYYRTARAMATNSDPNQPSGYLKSVSYKYGDSADVNEWVGDSYNLYGTRRLDSAYASADWLVLDQDAWFYSKTLLTRYGLERLVVTLSVPVMGRTYDQIELMDIIQISHIDMPNQYGTIREGRTPFPVDEGDTVGDRTRNSNLNNNTLWHEAKIYPMRVVGRKLNFNLGAQQAPELILTLDVLNNPKEIK